MMMMQDNDWIGILRLCAKVYLVVGLISGLVTAYQLGDMFGTINRQTGDSSINGLVFVVVLVTSALVTLVVVAVIMVILDMATNISITAKNSITSTSDIAELKKAFADKGKKVSVAEPTTPAETSINKFDALTKRAFLSLEDGDWDKANELFEQALNIEPENAKTYVGKLCVELKLNSEEMLLAYELPLDNYNNYKRAVQFADSEYLETIKLYTLTPKEQEEHKNSEKIKQKQLSTNFKSFFARAENMKNAKEIYESYINDEIYLPDDQQAKVKAEMEKILAAERMYGSQKRTTLRLLEKYLKES